MRKLITFILAAALLFAAVPLTETRAQTATSAASGSYVPSESNLKARREFSSKRLGIFLHWGIYAMYGQGEWYLNNGRLLETEYRKAAKGFYPIEFNAEEWVKAFKDAGAGYITLTSRHHDGFSLFKTATSDYNIVDGTPFGRDVVGELAKACADEGLRFHLYYSILDWHREDYPVMNTGTYTGRRTDLQDYGSYFNFMKTQVKELLTQYPNLGCLWFDGYWDKNNPRFKDFDWRMPEFYDYIHSIKSDCLIGNNHHIDPIEGEDIMMFERDLPGDNTTGWVGYTSVSDKLPLEMCTTMAKGAWGYEVGTTDYMSLDELIVLLLKSAAKNSNLLINIGPQPDGNLPAKALERLQGLGKWMRKYSSTVDGTTSTSIPQQAWGVTTRTADKIFLHVLSPKEIPSNGKMGQLVVPMGEKVAAVKDFAAGTPLTWKLSKDGFLMITTPAKPDASPDWVVEIDLK